MNDTAVDHGLCAQVHWGHPGNMFVVLSAMGGYGSYLGWQIRLSDDGVRATTLPPLQHHTTPTLHKHHQLHARPFEEYNPYAPNPSGMITPARAHVCVYGCQAL